MKKENVNITTIAFWAEHTGKEKLFFSFVVPFLCLFFAVTGLIGCFVTAFSLQPVLTLLYGGLFLMSVFWTVFSRLKLDGIYRFLAFIAVMVVESIFLLFMQAKAISGFFQTANGVFESLNESYHGSIALYQVGENAMELTIFLLFLLFPITGLLSLGMVRKQNVWCLAAVAFPVVFCGCLTNGTLEEGYLFLLFFSFLALLLESALVTPFSLEGEVKEERYYQEIKSKVLLALLLPLVVLSVISFSALRPALHPPITKVRDAGSKTENGVLQLVWSVLPGISGGRMELTVEGVGGGVDEGALGGTEGYYFGKVQALKVTCEESPKETLYLKGYIGSEYTGNSFDAYSGESLLNAAQGWKTDGSPLLYVQNLPFLRMMYAENVTVTGEDEEETELAEELTSSALSLTVENLNANDAYTYVPYYAFLNDYYEMLSGDGAVASQTRTEDTYSYYPRGAYEEKMTEWQELEDAHGVLDSVEAAYESYVKSMYLQIPDTGLEQLQAECESAEIEGIKDITKIETIEDIEKVKEYVVKTLTERATFDMDVESLPEGKDFVAWFLYEKKVGYSTHFAASATMMFRMFGIPSRYVVGYAAPEGLFTMKSDGSYEAILEDDNAHAWTEIYISGIGWVPVETTPGYVAMAAEGTGDAIGAGETTSSDAEEKEPEESLEPKPQEEPEAMEAAGTPIWQKAVAIFVICFVLVIATAIIRRRILTRKRAGKETKLDTAGNIKYVYGSFRSLLAFDGWSEAPGCESEDFGILLSEQYKAGSEEDWNTFAMIVLMTYYGYDERKPGELYHLTSMYAAVAGEVYSKQKLGGKLRFKWWWCY